GYGVGYFVSVNLVIIAVVSSGLILQRIRALNVQAVAAVSLYIFTPALVFDSLYEAEFNLGYMEILIFMFVLFYAMVFINKMLAKIWKWEQSTESAAILATGFMNSGNYGSRSTSSMSRALKNVMKMPTTYAAIIAIGFQLLHVPMSEAVLSTVSMVGDAAIPLMMVMLGMQLGSIVSMRNNWQVIISGVVLKMIAAPLIAFLFVWAFDVDPLIGAVLIIISAMPTAATTTMYAIEFDTEPDLVSSITFISTVL